MSITHPAHFDSAKAASGASASEAVAGIVAIVLTILGLAHVSPAFLMAVATIAVGVALISHGGMVATEYATLVSQPDETRPAAADLGGSAAWSLELLAGAAGIVLGILALLQVASMDLMAIAAIAFGGALVFSSGSSAQFNLMRLTTVGLGQQAQRLAASMLSGSVAIQAVAGLAAVVLGILALAGFSSMTLILTALLTLGAFIFMNGSTLTGAMLMTFDR
ncbi:hypothetical protein [Reyranella sp.]|jgi:hypothetical protein|uniref:hypothetical protein n=1 Tax=Reyranella sp. TaxID=1929291 RepID=UPI002F9283E0